MLSVTQSVVPHVSAMHDNAWQYMVQHNVADTYAYPQSIHGEIHVRLLIYGTE